MPRYWVKCICTRLHVFASLSGVFFSPLSLKYIISFLPDPSDPVRSCLLCVSCCVSVACPVLSSVCAPWLPCRLPSPLLSLYPHRARPEAPRRPSVCPAVCRHSSIIRRKTVWQCGQMHRVYIPGLLSSCLCAAVPCAVPCAVASCRPSVCVCCLLSSGGNNSRYASMSRAAAIRCSVWSVMLLLSIWIYTFCRVCPRRFASSTMPTPTAAMCSRM